MSSEENFLNELAGIDVWDKIVKVTSLTARGARVMLISRVKGWLGGNTKEGTPLSQEEYDEGTHFLEIVLGKKWIDDVLAGRLPIPGPKAYVHDQQLQLYFVPPEGVTIHNAEAIAQDSPFTFSYSFVRKEDKRPLGDASENLLEPRLVAIMTQIVTGLRETHIDNR